MGVLSVDPFVKATLRNNGTAVTLDSYAHLLNGENGSVYYSDPQCSGSALTKKNLGQELWINSRSQPIRLFYVSTGQEFSNILTKSVRSMTGGCFNSENVLTVAYLVAPYTPPSEVLNAVYPLRREQLP